MSVTKFEARVPADEPPLRADRAVARLFPDMPAHAVREAFRARDVKIGARRLSPGDMVRPGDTLTVYCAEAFGALALDIVSEDGEYIIINKRQGVPVQGAGSVEAQLTRCAGAPVFACHRLDVQTGGLLLLAKTDAARDEAERAFRDHALEKTYRALVRGRPSPDEAVLDAFLVKNARAATVRVLDTPARGALPIRTRYRVIREDAKGGMPPDGGISRLEIGLITGRTHQIRAHLAHIGHPVLGDDKYGDRALNRAHGARRQRLWATRLALWDGRVFEVKEPF